MDSRQQALTNAYHDVLSVLPQYWLDRSRSQDTEYAKLSGLFLPGTSTLYQLAPQKILVIGRETRRWDVLRGDDEFQTLKGYICKAMATQQDHLAKFMLKPRDRGASFFNLLRDLGDDHGTSSIAWANLFSFAWNKKSPMGWKHFSTLLEISEQLLKVQIEILQPDIIIFANGASSAKFRQRYFPHKGEGIVCTEVGDFCGDGIPRSQLWRFTLNKRIKCFRIQHPSSISAPSRAARRFLLDHLRGDEDGGGGERGLLARLNP